MASLTSRVELLSMLSLMLAEN
eukprot:COSAG03_NODE_12104_length_555_cov_0.625541_1_plen_21_part_10